MTSFDYFIITVLVISSVYGIIRGFIKESLSLIGLVLSFYLASTFDDSIASLIPVQDKSEIIIVVAFIIIFVGTLLLTSFFVKLMNKVLRFAGLSLMNRCFGFMFGLARGLIIILILVYLNQLLPFVSLINQDKSFILPLLDPIFSFILDYLPKYQVTHVEYEYAVLTKEYI